VAKRAGHGACSARTLAEMDTEVLVVGAGPTGLVLALWLARAGVAVRVIDKSAEPGTTSRAVVVQARTLEFYRQLGIAEEVVAAGLEFRSVNLWAGAKKRAHVDFGRLGEGLSPFPFALIYPQDEHERLLLSKLDALGVKVERNTELEGLEERGERVRARVAGSSSEAAFVAGCDGARSSVREALGIDFAGGTYEHRFYVADVEASGPLMNRELHVSLDEADIMALFPLASQGRARLIGSLPDSAGSAEKELGWEAVSKDLFARLELRVDRVHWFSTYRVHHRVARRFRSGRVFLLGDAAHVHSPVGGQGMNTGIGDAVNLAWKLAEVLRGRAGASLLESYEPERMGFARRLVATTDRAFQFATRSGPLAASVRVNLVPSVVAAAFRAASVRRFLFRTVSQTDIAYRESALSEGGTGPLRAGDRLPWLRGESGPDNFEPLTSLAWQMHVYGSASADLAATCARRALPLHVFARSAAAGRLGFAHDAGYLVRPDGHLAFVNRAQRSDELEHYLDARELGRARVP
jgi:2-polyprenyl-6-methoxyphenol hydroxylase-like FAD-dependent oxidoreductase